MSIRDEDLEDWHTVNWCIEQMNVKTDKPKFIAAGLHKPHLPFAPPKKYYDAFPLEDIQLPPFLETDLDDIPARGIRMAGPQNDYARFQENGRWKAAIRSYLATCAYTDMNIGRLLDGLDKSPIADNTIIVLWGDHGWSLGEKKHFRKFALWEEPTRMPYIWVAPGITQAGTRRFLLVILFNRIFLATCFRVAISISPLPSFDLDLPLRGNEIPALLDILSKF